MKTEAIREYSGFLFDSADGVQRPERINVKSDAPGALVHVSGLKDSYSIDEFDKLANAVRETAEMVRRSFQLKLALPSCGERK